LLVYIIVYISRSYARPSSFLPFVIMMFALIVNTASSSTPFSFRPFRQYLTSDTALYITYIMRHQLVRISLYFLVAWKSSCTKPPNIQPKLPTNKAPTNASNTYATINNNATLQSGFGGFGLHSNSSSIGFHSNSSNTPNRFSRSTAERVPQPQPSPDSFSLGDLGVHSLDTMLSRIEISQNEPNRKPNSHMRRYLSIGSCIMIILGGLLYFGFEVNSSSF